MQSVTKAREQAIAGPVGSTTPGYELGRNWRVYGKQFSAELAKVSMETTDGNSSRVVCGSVPSDNGASADGHGADNGTARGAITLADRERRV